MKEDERKRGCRTPHEGTADAAGAQAVCALTALAKRNEMIVEVFMVSGMGVDVWMNWRADV